MVDLGVFSALTLTVPLVQRDKISGHDEVASPKPMPSFGRLWRIWPNGPT
jgi:hypothetical protein